MSYPVRPLGLGLIVVLAGVLVFLLVSGGTEPGPGEDPTLVRIPRPRPAGVDPDPIPDTPSEEPTAAPEPPSVVAAPIGGVTSLVGLREPEGIDLSDPAQAIARLEALLGATPRDWRAIQRVLEVVKTPLGTDLRRELVDALSGPTLGLVKEALVRSSDPELATDLFRVLDDPDTDGRLRSAALNILGRLPGADAEDVVLGLEARLEGETGRDVAVLRAIAARGGREGARAIVEYLEASKDPLRLPRRGGLGLDLTKDAEAAELFEAAIRRATTPALTRVLAEMVAAPGAERFVESLASLDRPSSPPEVQKLALGALAEIGTASAVEHLLDAAASRDPVRGDAAWASIAHMVSAEPKARASLMKSLDEADESGLAPPAKRSLLQALGNLGHRPAAPALAAALDDTDPTTRQVGAVGLGKMGEAGRPYVAKLIETYGAADLGGKRQVVLALGGIGGDEARSALLKLAADRKIESSLRRSVETALRRFSAKEAPKTEGAAPGGR